MITKETNPTVDHEKYYIDMNSPEYQSVWRLMSLFQYVSKHDLKLPKVTVSKVFKKMDKTEDPKELAKIMDKYMKDIAVFYWGPKEESEIQSKKKESIEEKPLPKTKKSTQTSLEENMKKHTKASKKKG